MGFIASFRGEDQQDVCSTARIAAQRTPGKGRKCKTTNSANTSPELIPTKTQKTDPDTPVLVNTAMTFMDDSPEKAIL